MNKEIEEILNTLNGIASGDWIQMLPKEANLLLSYIEQLENNRDKAIKFGNGLLLGEATFEERHIANKFLKILKGDSDE